MCLWLVSGLCSTMSWLEADAQAVRIRLYHDTSMHEQFPHVLDLINAWNGKRLSFLVFIFIPWTHCWTSAAGIIVPQSFAGEPFMFVWSLIGFPLRSTSFGASKPARSQNAPPHHTGKGPVSTFLWIPIVTEVLLWTKWMGYLHSKPESSHRIYQFNPIYLKSSASVTPVLIITNTVLAQVAHTSRRLISPLSVIKWSW